MNIGLLVCIIGAIISFLSIALEWTSISVTLADGTQESVSITGWQLLTDDGASEVIDGTFLPAAVVLLTIVSLAICIATRFSPNVPSPHSLLILINIVVLSCPVIFMGINGGIIGLTMDTTPWLESLFSAEIVSGSVMNGIGGFAGMIGNVIIYCGLFEIMNHNPTYSKMLTAIKLKSDNSEKSLKIEIGRPGNGESKRLPTTEASD